MERKKVKSSNVVSVGYDSKNKIMEVEFGHGGIYQYLKVPERVYTGMLQSESAGKYFHQVVKENYAFKKLPDSTEK